MDEENKSIVKEKKNKVLVIITLIFLMLFLSTCTYLYFNNQINKDDNKTQLFDNKTIVGKVGKYIALKEKNKYGSFDYYVYDNNKNEYLAFSNFLSVDGNENYFRLYDNNREILLNIKDSIVIDIEHNHYSCRFFSDAKYSICLDDTIIASKIIAEASKYSVISLKTGENVLDVEFDEIAQDNNGNFLVKSDNKYGLFSSEGKLLLEIKYDYLGYINDFGYFTIIGNDLIAYDLKLNEKSFFTDIKEEIEITNSSSYFWSGGSILIHYDINKAYGDEKEGIKYIGNDYSGNQLVIYDVYAGCYSDPIMYVIKGNKAYKINPIDVRKPTNDCF